MEEKVQELNLDELQNVSGGVNYYDPHQKHKSPQEYKCPK